MVFQYSHSQGYVPQLTTMKSSVTSRLRTWFNNLPIQDLVERRMAALLQFILIGLSVIVILVTIARLGTPSLDAQERLIVLKGNLFGFLVVVLPLALLRRGYFRLSALIIIFILFITPALAITVFFDLPNSGGVIFQFTLAIILAGLLVGRRVLILVFGLSAALVAFSVFRWQSTEPHLATVSMQTATNFILFNGLITLFLDQFGITLRTTLTHALGHERELQDEIIERKQVEQKLLQSEESFSKAF